MQHAQFNFVPLKILAVVAMVLAGQPAWAATMAQPSKPDPLLDGGPTTPCAAGADYAEGIDANGKAVARADVAARPAPLPDAIAIPLGGNRPQASGRRPSNAQTLGSNGAYVTLEGRKLEPLLNPKPCSDPGR